MNWKKPRRFCAIQTVGHPHWPRWHLWSLSHLSNFQKRSEHYLESRPISDKSFLPWWIDSICKFLVYINNQFITISIKISVLTKSNNFPKFNNFYQILQFWAKFNFLIQIFQFFTIDFYKIPITRQWRQCRQITWKCVTLVLGINLCSPFICSQWTVDSVCVTSSPIRLILSEKLIVHCTPLMCHLCFCVFVCLCICICVFASLIRLIVSEKMIVHCTPLMCHLLLFFLWRNTHRDSLKCEQSIWSNPIKIQ